MDDQTTTSDSPRGPSNEFNNNDHNSPTASPRTSASASDPDPDPDSPQEDQSKGPPPKGLPDDLPKSLDDRSMPVFQQETEMYDAWQGKYPI